MDMKNCTDRHQRALSSIHHALVLQEQPEAWRGLETILRACLTPYERASLLSSVAMANEIDLLIEVLETIVPARLAGSPLPVFLDIDAEARWWADLATRSERQAWLKACFLKLSEQDKADFLAAAMQKVAA